MQKVKFLHIPHRIYHSNVSRRQKYIHPNNKKHQTSILRKEKKNIKHRIGFLQKHNNGAYLIDKQPIESQPVDSCQ
jgi:hypothetical protein